MSAASRLRDRVIALSAKVPVPGPPTEAVVAAGDLLDGDRVRFAGHWFAVNHAGHYGDRVEVDATDGAGSIVVAYRPFEAVEVALPRPVVGRRAG